MKKPTETKPGAPRGFAVIPKKRGIEIARMGGKALSKQRGSAYMADLGRQGGLSKRNAKAA